MMNNYPLNITVFIVFSIVLYFFKILITVKVEGRVKAVACYLVVLALGLTFLYSIVVEWNSIHENAAFHWFGVPILFLTIPTITFIYDLRHQEKHTVRFLVLRSVLEVFVLFPIWFVSVLFIVFGVILRWIYIGIGP